MRPPTVTLQTREVRNWLRQEHGPSTSLVAPQSDPEAEAGTACHHHVWARNGREKAGEGGKKGEGREKVERRREEGGRYEGRKRVEESGGRKEEERKMREGGRRREKGRDEGGWRQEGKEE